MSVRLSPVTRRDRYFLIFAGCVGLTERLPGCRRLCPLRSKTCVSITAVRKSLSGRAAAQALASWLSRSRQTSKRRLSGRFERQVPMDVAVVARPAMGRGRFRGESGPGGLAGKSDWGHGGFSGGGSPTSVPAACASSPPNTTARCRPPAIFRQPFRGLRANNGR